MKRFVVQVLPNTILVHQLIDGELVTKDRRRRTPTTTAATVECELRAHYPDAAIKIRKSASLEVPKVWTR